MPQQPLVIAYHLVWTAYGYWLPNDPRGSGSKTVRNDVLAELGAIHFGRKKIQPTGTEIKRFRSQVADFLKHPVLTFDETQRQIVATSFAEVIATERYTCYACAIMPDHVHILIRKHKHSAEEMMEDLREASRSRLITENLRTAIHPTWTAGSGWKVFLDHPDEIRRTIRYIGKNPAEIGLPPQSWAFVTLYDGWPLHPGHSPNSPYAKRLRAAGRYP